MSRRCDLTGKAVLVGHKVSHSNIKTKRRFLPNLLNVTMISDALGRSVKLRVSANALKTVDHRGGLDAFLMQAKDDELAPKVRELKRAIVEEAGRRLSLPIVPAPRRACHSLSDQRELQQHRALQQREIVVRDQRQHQRAVGVAMHRQAFHVVDLVAHVGDDQHRAVDQRAGLDRGERHAADAHGDAAAPGEPALQHQELAAAASPRNR